MSLQRIGAFALGCSLLIVAISCGGGPSTSTPVAPGGTPPSPAAAACSFTISSNAVNVGATAGPTSLTVTTGATCAWTVKSDSAFLAVTSGTGQTGSGVITFTVAENKGALRVATLTIGDAVVQQMVTVNQGAAGAQLVFNPANPPDGTVGVPYNFSFAVATGGVEPIHYQLETAGGFPPIGLVLAPSGVLSGIPTIANAGASFSVCAVDAGGHSVCRAMTIAVIQAESAAFGNWRGTITLEAGCVEPLPFHYGWSGPIRRNAGGGVELVLSVPLLEIKNEVLAVTLTGNTISFGYDYGPYRYEYVGTLSSNQRSVQGTFTGTGCNPPLNTQQRGSWNGIRE